MTSLTEFLLARIAEDETVARNAVGHGETDDRGRWEWVEYEYEGGSPQPLGSLAETPCASGYDPDWTWSRLVNRHDPARVLARCAADRRIVEDADTYVGEFENESWRTDDQVTAGRIAGRARSWQDDTLRALASVYADHEDFDESWRP